MLLWHGSRRWDGRPEIRKSRRGRAEHGPGIYLTTRLETAWKYAKGGGRLYLFELDEGIRWIRGKKIALQAMQAFVEGLCRVPRRQIVADLARHQERYASSLLPASILVNTLVDTDALTGDNGPQLVEFLVEHGIDGDCIKQSNEDWVVLFNPERVLRYSPRSRTQIPVSMYDLPKVCE